MKTKFDIGLLREYEEKGLITGRNHPTLPLVVWNYTAETQFGRLWDEITLQTRGLVTDLQGRTIAPCISKFFNLGETDYAIEDFDVAQEKLDGSLIHVFWYDDQWVCSSRGSFESDHAQWAQELVDSHADHDGFSMKIRNAEVSFVCELIHPENRIVVDYDDEKSLRLITMFAKGLDSESIWEEFSAFAWPWPWNKVERMTLSEANEYMNLSGIEGVVLIGEPGRVKIKTDEYIEHHRIVIGLTTKNVLQHYMEHGSVTKLLEVAPDEWYERIGSLAWDFVTKVQFTESMIRSQFKNVRESFDHKMSRKDFALAVAKQVNSSYMFRLLDGKEITTMIMRNILDDYKRHGLEL